MTSKTGASVDVEIAGNSGDAAIPTTASNPSELANLSNEALNSLSEKFGIPVFAVVASIAALLLGLKLLCCCICIFKMCCKKKKGLKGVDLTSVSMLENSLMEQEAQAYADDNSLLLIGNIS
ncbi:uncharacterized protein [Antedon mediterranea]